MSEPSTGHVPPAVRWADGCVVLLDQRRLPGEVVELVIDDPVVLRDAIRDLAVRGAPAIGLAAAWGLAMAAHRIRTAPRDAVMAELERAGSLLRAARPTAVNLAGAIDTVLLRARASEKPAHAAFMAAYDLHEADRRMCRAIAAAGRALIQPGMGVLTHCNAGALAVSELGTATAPMYQAHADGVPFRVWVDETRPVLQGARLTAWELSRAGLDVTLICDSMAASLMAAGEVDVVLVGTDRVTANGDVVNKIGTLGLAVLARHYRIPFWVACPASTFDPHTPNGAAVPIEMRAAAEVHSFAGNAVAPLDIAVHNPAFDVTPADLVTGFVTDRGRIVPPYARSLRILAGR